MKKPILLLILALSLTSCAAQTPQPTQYITIPLTVNTIAAGEITFQTESGHLLLAEKNSEAFTIPQGIVLEEGRNYLVSFRYLDKSGFKPRIEIVGFSVSPKQARKDAAKLSLKFKAP